ncbi:MAG: NUDIX domain-containing protein [Gammaproteobacteria bacterium]|nr:NUDIX domain-containing protein [Gammaproteobacteria bacterium]MBU1724862.1 NUDIX domain-containing protein [Gammaproteobacteria bacterium]MBU2005046.1 NUDIX domain-containing protein [Gammaproteobacteria bacterium]
MSHYTVKDLLEGKLPAVYRDKVFWFAERVIQTDEYINLYINNKTGLTAFEPFAQELGVIPVSQLASLSATTSWNTGEKPVLVSSGSFLWINGKLLVTQRTADTKYDPLAWTAPAGRCDDTPLRTALKETIEEIHVQSVESGRLWMPDLARGVLPEGTDVNFYPTTVAFPYGLDGKLVKSRTWIDNKLIEESMLWMMFSEKSNTIEFRVPLVAAIDENLLYTNPEYHTDVQAVMLEELKEMQLVPAVRQLLSEGVT